MRWNVELCIMMKCDQRRTQKEAGTRGGQRGQDNFKLAANFGYNSRGSADPRESLRKRRILKLALTAHTVLPTPGARLLLLSTDISTTPTLLFIPYCPFIIANMFPTPPFPWPTLRKFTLTQ